MPRKQKPRERRPKPVYESLFYTTSELIRRYNVSRRTLRRWTAERGYPKERKNGKEACYAKVQVHDWERIHMPELHTEPEKSEDDKRWDRMSRQWKLDKEELATPPPPKPRRPPSRGART